MTSTSRHIPVLVDEVCQLLAPQPGQTIVDGTVGGGGHARRLADCVGPTGLVIALDRDPAAISQANQALHGLPIQSANENFCDLPAVLEELGISHVHGILLDLGMSSDQLADQQRGFSFTAAGPLDLRFNPELDEPAWQLLNRLSVQELAKLIYEYGEERYSRRIARKIVSQRRGRPVWTSMQLAELVRRCVPKRPGRQRIHPATRTFQALRIAVNDELESLETALRCLPDCLHAGARLAVISFHSLEDRLVKSAFRKDDRYEIINRKPIRPTAEEIECNPRSRSARLRVAQRA